MADWNPKEYLDTGLILEWGKDLTANQMALLKNGEIFTLCDQDGKPYSKVLMDSYDTIRERRLGAGNG